MTKKSAFRGSIPALSCLLILLLQTLGQSEKHKAFFRSYGQKMPTWPTGCSRGSWPERKWILRPMQIPSFNLSNAFRLFANEDLYRAVDVAKSFKYDAPRATVTLAIGSKILKQE